MKNIKPLLPLRIYNILKASGISTVKQLEFEAAASLSRITGLGERRIQTIGDSNAIKESRKASFFGFFVVPEYSPEQISRRFKTSPLRSFIK